MSSDDSPTWEFQRGSLFETDMYLRCSHNMLIPRFMVAQCIYWPKKLLKSFYEIYDKGSIILTKLINSVRNKFAWKSSYEKINMKIPIKCILKRRHVNFNWNSWNKMSKRLLKICFQSILTPTVPHDFWKWTPLCAIFGRNINPL